MERILLYSSPAGKVFPEILKLTFPESMDRKVLAYLPSDGANTKQKYIDEWKQYAKEHGAKFVCVDNSKRGEEAKKEIEKLYGANILVISGGNTFTLLDHLRKSGLDEAIKKFTEKPEFVLSGFSAGAIVLTPSIASSGLKGGDINTVGIKDLSGLGIVDFEIFAHYSKQWEEVCGKFEEETDNKVEKLSDEDYIVMDL